MADTLTRPRLDASPDSLEQFAAEQATLARDDAEADQEYAGEREEEGFDDAEELEEEEGEEEEGEDD